MILPITSETNYYYTTFFSIEETEHEQFGNKETKITEVITHYHHSSSSTILLEIVTGTSPFDSNLVQMRQKYMTSPQHLTISASTH